MFADDIISEEDIRRFLEEDVGAGDVTAAIIPGEYLATAEIRTREETVLCGQAGFSMIFRILDEGMEISWYHADGELVPKDTIICSLRGNARALLTGERTALNLLQTLSATAGVARRYAQAIQGTGAKVLDTRKTLPGLRKAQKYAVRCGGCENHRAGLFDAILIKENHIAAAGSIQDAVRSAQTLSKDLTVQVEVENLDELNQALSAGADRILLDNFDLGLLRQAVAINQGQAVLEASGNITLENIRKIAETGVDFISVGALTKNVKAVDLSMRVMLVV